MQRGVGEEGWGDGDACVMMKLQHFTREVQGKTLGRAWGKFLVAMRMRGKTGAQRGVSMMISGGPLTAEGCCALAMAAA